MFCFHKFGKIENGYQHCEKCGLARSVQCSHNWKIIKEIRVFKSNYASAMQNELPTGFQYVLQCQHCGDIKKEYA